MILQPTNRTDALLLCSSIVEIVFHIISNEDFSCLIQIHSLSCLGVGLLLYQHMRRFVDVRGRSESKVTMLQTNRH